MMHKGDGTIYETDLSGNVTEITTFKKDVFNTKVLSVHRSGNVVTANTEYHELIFEFGEESDSDHCYRELKKLVDKKSEIRFEYEV